MEATGMMTGVKRYDPELQMFVIEPREPDVGRLLFLRWLHERGQLEERTPRSTRRVHVDPLPPEPPSAA
jgi:hypothetical protein